MDVEFIRYNDLIIYYKIGNLECYPPKEDSFLLAKNLEKYVKNKKILDLGCGSGIQGLVSYKYTKEIVFSDIDENCLKISKINFYINYIEKKDPFELVNLIDKINFNVKFIKSNLFENINEKFDIILFNPPYLPEIEGEDEKVKRWVAGGKFGNEIIINFLESAHKYLNNNGKILLIISSISDPFTTFYNFSKIYEFKLIDSENFFFEKLFLYEIKLKI